MHEISILCIIDWLIDLFYWSKSALYSWRDDWVLTHNITIHNKYLEVALTVPPKNVWMRWCIYKVCACVLCVLSVTVIPDSLSGTPHMALLLSVWEELCLCLGVWGGRPLCLGGAGGGPKDNWRSLFRQPLVDLYRSGARVVDQSKCACVIVGRSLGLWGHFSAFKQVVMVICCNKLGVRPPTFIL